MFAVILLLLIVVPIVELWVLFQVADSLGWLTSIGLLLLVSAVGAALMRWQTTGAWSRIMGRMRDGQLPSDELIDGALMIFGGALLLTPGFFTDLFGLAMFIPPTRALARRAVRKRVDARVQVFKADTASRVGMTFGPGAAAGATGPRGARTGRWPNSTIDVEPVEVIRTDGVDPLRPQVSPPSPPGARQ